MSKKRETLKERVLKLEITVNELIKKVDNHCHAHAIDRIVQALTLVGMVLILYLIKFLIK